MAEKQDSVHFVLCPLQGNKIEGVVPSREYILGFSFVLNRVRVSNPQRLTYAQINIGRLPPGYACLLLKLPFHSQKVIR